MGATTPIRPKWPRRHPWLTGIIVLVVLCVSVGIIRPAQPQGMTQAQQTATGYLNPVTLAAAINQHQENATGDYTAVTNCQPTQGTPDSFTCDLTLTDNGDAEVYNVQVSPDGSNYNAVPEGR